MQSVFLESGDKMDEYTLLKINAEQLKSVAPFEPKVALVLGSGLGGLISDEDITASLDFGELQEFPTSTVDGHRGRFIFSKICGVPTVAMQGRVHLYEGYSPLEVVRPIRLMKMLGTDLLMLTNAAGGINQSLSCGDLMLITDHISSFVPSPLIGSNISELGVRFPDMTEVYSKKLQSLAFSCADKLKIDLKSGVYVQTTGPNYETPAEIKMYSTMGADAVGMSTAIEAMTAAHMGMEVCAVSLITNAAAGLSTNPLSHEEVKKEADKASEKMSALVREIIKGMVK